MDIAAHLRNARQRLKQRADSSQRSSEIVHRNNVKALAPIVKVLEKIRQEGYYFRGEDGSRQPFDFRYTPGDFYVECLIYITIRRFTGNYSVKTGLYRIRFHNDSYDTFTLSFDLYPDGAVSSSGPEPSQVIGYECMGARDCIEKFMEFAAEHEFLLHD